MGGRIFTRAVLASAVLWLSACAADDAYRVTEWTLAVPGEVAPVEVHLPQYLNRHLPNHQLTYELTTDITLPPALRGQELVFAIPFLPGIVELRVNGEKVTPISGTLTQSYRSTGPQAFLVPARLTQAGSARYQMRVMHNQTQSGWFESVPALTRNPNGSREYILSRVLVEGGASVCLGVMMTTGFIYLGIFMFNRRRRSYGWFAIQAWTACTYPFFTLGLSQRLFGHWDMPLLAITLGVAPLAGIYFTHAEFNLPRPSRVWTWLLVVVIATAIIAHRPFVVMLYAAPATLLFVFAGVIYHLITLGRIARRTRVLTAYLLFAAWFALALGAGVDGAAWLGFFENLGGVRFASVSLALFALLQSVALSREHFVKLNHADDLNEELGGKLDQLTLQQTEVQRLNGELRRQVTERSRELSDALHRLAGPGAETRRLEIGEVIQDRYQVVGEIGEGGMGTVYEVERISDKLHLALKATTAMAGSGSLALARLAREAQIAGQLNHPNVVSIIDVDIATSGFLYIVMELVRGKSLNEERALFSDKRWCISVLKQLADGLDALHAHGVIHRDLKPANILLRNARTQNVEVKITDFGISSLDAGDEAFAAAPAPPAVALSNIASIDPAKTATQEINLIALKAQKSGPKSGSSLTQTGIVMGTPLYMAPELARGVRYARPAADMFSFGVIAYEVLVGERPFSDAECMARFSGVPLIVPWRAKHFLEHCPDLGPELASMLDRALSESPETRPTAREVADALQRHTQRPAQLLRQLGSSE